ncbi:Gfo/Idh/MocA family oxidoreductase [Paenibacillus aurantius]|uniref:Gfo/Idh/MocA family oxidoreductase n=1 Tax=Paenibacillus aurantius TaxID=2918900 RepID=A0AA96LH15_9BACL|nr:Gfo/Idh/MocA family oxidoreductase [Paenibacillus aurantius]WNQ11836.1 Gfo/Idh/MocA family oxidoreductase [Paenibacillus aurantius]
MTKPFRIIQAGCGGMANTWVEYALAREDAELVALVDLQEASARAMAERHGLTCPWFSDVEEAIRQTGANLVFDVTIPAAHKNITTASLRAGCDVLGEKPMAESMEDAEDMAREAGRAGRMYAVMQNRRYLKEIRAYRELVAGGVIGQTGFVTANFFLGPHFGGFREAMESPLLLDMSIHTFDQARLIIGSDPVSVYCHEFNPPGSWYAGNAAAACIFEFANGTVFTYNGSWCAEGAPTSWEASWRAVGSKGTAIWDGAAPYAEIVKPRPDGSFTSGLERFEAPFTWEGREGHKGCLDEMFAALLEGRPAETVCTDNLHSMAMVFGARESARTGQKVLLRR